MRRGASSRSASDISISSSCEEKRSTDLQSLTLTASTDTLEEQFERLNSKTDFAIAKELVSH